MEVRDAEKDSTSYRNAEQPSIAITGASGAIAATGNSTAAATTMDPVEYLAAVYRDFPGLRTLIMRRVRDPQLAADILQDAAVTTLEKLRAGKISQPSAVGGYLYRVALNHLRNYRRKDRTSLSGSDELDSLPDHDTPDIVELDRAHWARAARSILDELPTARDRDVLVRFYLNDESREDICSALALSDEHFNRVIFRARNRFRELLERRGYAKIDLLTFAAFALCLGTAYATITSVPGVTL